MEKKSLPKIRSNLNLLIAILVIAASFALFSYTLKDVKFATGADEGFYFKYATYIGEKGVFGFQDLFRDYVQNQQNWLFPNPLRIGFIALSAIWLKITGSSLLNLAYLSLLCFYLFVFFSYCFVKKYFSQELALLLTTLLAFSPLNMAVARRALMDSASNLFTFLSVWLFLESIKENNSRKSTLFVLIYSFTILTKEISVFLSVFFVFYLFLRRIIFKKPLKLKDFLAATVFPFGIAGIVYIVMAGGISWVFDTAEIILNSPQNNQYALLFGSGPWFRYLIDWMLLSPWVFILALGFCIHYLTKNEWQEEIFYLLLYSAMAVFILSIFTKNIRYLIFLDMPIRLFSLLMLNELRKRFFKEKGFVVLVVLTVCISLFDYLNFYNLFIRHSIYDPVTYWLLQAWHIIPWK